MNYVEWLRVRNCLRIAAIILAVLVVLAVILRVSVARYMSTEAWIAHMALNTGSKETHTVLPDGTKRMILDDPADRTHVVVDDHGYAGRHIVITEPSSREHEEHSHVNVGSIQVSESRHGRLDHDGRGHQWGRSDDVLHGDRGRRGARSWRQSSRHRWRGRSTGIWRSR